MLFSIGLNHKAVNESEGCKVMTYSIYYQVYTRFPGLDKRCNTGIDVSLGREMNSIPAYESVIGSHFMRS